MRGGRGPGGCGGVKVERRNPFREKGLPVSDAAVRLSKARPGTSSLALAVQRS